MLINPLLSKAGIVLLLSSFAPCEARGTPRPETTPLLDPTTGASASSASSSHPVPVFDAPRRGGAFRPRRSAVAFASNSKAGPLENLGDISGGGAPSVQEEAEAEFSLAAIATRRTGVLDAAKKFVELVTTTKRGVYFISFVLSLIYGYYFFFSDVTPNCQTFSEGFCVTNLVDGCDASKINCKSYPPGNSHTWAFLEDIVFTIVAIALPFVKDYGDAPPPDLLMRVAIPLIIIGHGGIHAWIASKDCNFGALGVLSSKQINDVLLGKIIYSIFSFALTAITYGFLSDLGFPWLRITLVTAFIIWASIGRGDIENPVSALFLVSHFLVSFIGTFNPGKGATLLIGQTFIFPCVVSLVEFLKCEWLNPLGGHAWYDFFLHISVISSLWPESENPEKKG